MSKVAQVVRDALLHLRAIDQHQVAPVGRFIDLDLLEWRLHLVQFPGDAIANRRARRFEVLVQPILLGHGGSNRFHEARL